MPPLRVERFNDHGRHPNRFISFIKEDRRVTTKDEQTRAVGILNRVAAIVYPIMKENGLQITTLEEHPFNDSYAGINYDAGDCIGLVLRTAHGGWVPETFVLSVLLHELSHCTNMHHAGPFWKTLGVYRIRMAQLRESGYTGEGFWRKGILLGSGDTTSLASVQSELPKAICGGAFKGSRFPRRRKKRAPGERAQKAVKTGHQLGGDIEIRKRLDGGKSKATPRVVKSKRGQELRATAAELRFSAQLTQQFPDKKEEESDSDELDSDAVPQWKYEDEDEGTQKLLHDEIKEEMQILKQSKLNFTPVSKGVRAEDSAATTPTLEEVVKQEPEVIELFDSSEELDTPSEVDDARREQDAVPFMQDPLSSLARSIDGEFCAPDSTICQICTFASPPSAVFCGGCGTLRKADQGAWICQSIDCTAVNYRNHRDSLICSLCGCRRS